MAAGWVAPTLRGYRLDQLRRDAPAGLTLTALLIPQGLAYAQLAGLPAVTGLYTTVVCLLAYALVGPSRVLVLGPDSSVSPLIFAALVPLAATDDPAEAVALAGALAVLVGLMEIGLGAGGFGFVATLLSKPVLIGYLNGLAVVIVVSQLPTLCGFGVDGQRVPTVAREFVRDLDQTRAASLLVGAVVLAAIAVGARWWPRFPLILVSVVLATAVSAVLGLAADGVPVVGPLPEGLPRPELPRVAAADVGSLAVAAVGILLVSLADSIAVSTSFAARRGERVDPDREIMAVGAANVAAGLFRGFAVSASSSRTAVADEAGARTQLAGVIGAVGVAVLLLAAPGLLADLPLSVLAAVVIVAAARLVDVTTLRRMLHSRPTSLVLSVATTVAVVALGVLPGVVVAVALSILFFFRRNWWPQDDTLGRVPGVRGWHSVHRYPEAQTLPGIVVYRWEAPLFFANAALFRERIRDLVRDTEPPPHHVILQCEAITDIDVTAADVLVELDAELADRGVELVLVELRDRLRDLLAAYRPGRDGSAGSSYRTIKEAMEAITGEDFDDLGLR